jgi:hypothetical protein
MRQESPTGKAYRFRRFSATLASDRIFGSDKARFVSAGKLCNKKSDT